MALLALMASERQVDLLVGTKAHGVERMLRRSLPRR